VKNVTDLSGSTKALVNYVLFVPKSLKFHHAC